MELEKYKRFAERLHLVGFLNKVHITEIARRIVHYQEIIRTGEYYRRHKNNIKLICKKLHDDESRMVFLDGINFRQSMKSKYIKPSSDGKQYFIPPVIDFIKKGGVIFVDCGAYTGDTIKDFLGYSVNGHRNIIAFEPDKKNYKILEENCKEVKNILLINAGVWSSNSELAFLNTGESVSRVLEGVGSDTEASKVQVKAIDSYGLKGKILIKMDIEGAETEALKGAENTINNLRPALAICIYHSDADMIQIPLWIIDKCNEYDYFIRHYCDTNVNEMVFYAIPREIGKK